MKNYKIGKVAIQILVTREQKERIDTLYQTVSETMKKNAFLTELLMQGVNVSKYNKGE